MADRVAGRIAIVTGGATGIGFGISRCLAGEGAKIIIASRHQERGERAVAQLVQDGAEARYFRTDVSHEGDCEALVNYAVREFGRLDVLVNNASVFPRSTLEETTEALWDHIFAINLKGPFFTCKHAIPAMRASGGGSIINIGSANAHIGGANLFAYSVSKGGLMTLTRNLARAHMKDGVRVNCVDPGWVITEKEIQIQALEGHDEEWIATIAKTRPAGRHEAPEDAGWAVVYLASDESAAVNGELISANSGATMR